MTILTAVFVNDGMVMAADSRVTLIQHLPDGRIIRSVHRDDEFKITLFNKVNVGVGYHGSTHIEGKSVPGILKEFESKYVHESDSVEEISIRLHELLKKHPDCEVCFIVCGYYEGVPYVYTVCEDARILEFRPGKPYRAIWRGDINKVNVRYSNVNINSKKTSLNDAIQLAESIVKTAIEEEEINGYKTCGGPIDILVLTEEKSWFHKHKILNL